MTYNITKRFSEMEWSQLELEQIKDFMVNELMAEIRKDVMRHVELESQWNIQHGGFDAKASVDLDFGVPIKDFSISMPSLTDDYQDIHKVLNKQVKDMTVEKLRRNLGYDVDEPFPNLNKIIADKQAEAHMNSFNPGRINNTSIDSLLGTVRVNQGIEGDSYWIVDDKGEKIDVTSIVEALKKRNLERDY